ncbi:tetratricopeptide repeat protein [Pyxidicoccus parkwayensis]|uniref:Tetratricopeptide repeat protein n=1 Tax=Pyxidicoccus parkwayensis TaxID=2813578 RepID=A0ABX7P6R2_9BACT|nr:serine/threonine-protein kinase [Pyxidicoccus parkwaysis]QSQ26164.1 tetratricopeptide repeat protein [Pyxidicoccus parkwaysis]
MAPPPLDEQSPESPAQPRRRNTGRSEVWEDAAEPQTTPVVPAERPQPRRSTAPEAERPLVRGTTVERYVLLKPIGQGGMGVVYAAYDPDLDRKVALKLLHAGLSGPLENGRARLLREAQAMARVSHPNVIAVHDVGTHGDQVFVAMELIQGQNLHDWVKQGGHSWRDVVRVFLEAGRGLAAAHQVGLIHRDFKPANVLMGPGSRVYVTDFGLARLAAEHVDEDALEAGEGDTREDPNGPGLAADLTAAGAVVGTPQYMPPEQYVAQGADARSDQFSFCASLYWALYGRRPFEHRHVQRIAATALQQSGTLSGEVLRGAQPGTVIREPPKDARVPAWVRRVVLRGLSLHPEDRFASMDALLEALSQHTRQSRWRMALLGVGTAALAALGFGVYVHHRAELCTGSESLVASTWGPAARQKLEAAFAATGRPFAKESAERVTRMLDGYARDWARQHTTVCEDTRVRGAQTEELMSLRMVCLERRRKDLGALVGQLTEADGKVVERAVDATAALPSLSQCGDVEALTEQTPRPANPRLRASIDQLDARLAEVKALFDAGRYPKALEEAKRLQPGVDAAEWLPLQAELRNHLGWLQVQMGDADAGLRELEKALDAAEASRSDRMRLEILIRLIFAQANHGQTGQAERWGEVAQALLTRLGGEPLLAMDLMGNLGNICLMQGRYPQARDFFEKARALQEDTLGSEHPKRAKVSFSLGLVALRQGESSRAIQFLTEALQQTEAAKGADHPEMGNRHAMLATALRESGDAARALTHAQAALEVRKAALGPEHPLVADALDEVGMCLIDLKRHDEALATFQRAVELKRNALGEEDSDLSYSYDGIGQVLLAQGRAADAIEPLRKALAYEEAEPEALAQTGFALARALWQTGTELANSRAEAVRARERFAELQKTARVTEIDLWLEQARDDAQTPTPEAPSKRVAALKKKRVRGR